MAKKDEKTNLVAYDAEKITALDVAAKEIKELSALKAESPFTAGMGMAMALDNMRELLSPEVMKYVMKLQGNKLGFLTDRDKKKDGRGKWVRGDGYGVEVVRDVLIEAFAVGGNMVGNEVNIINAGMYLTKNYFFRMLDDNLGRDNWSLSHGIPHIISKQKTGQGGKQYTEIVGATVETIISWKDKTGAHTEKISKAIKGDAYASADAYHGKADRKAAAWLLGMVTGERYDEGDVESNTIDVTASVVEDGTVDNTSNNMADAKDIEYLHILISQSSIKDLDIAAQSLMELQGEPLTKTEFRKIYMELVKAIRKEGGNIPPMPKDGVAEKPVEKEPETVVEDVEPDEFNTTKEQDLIALINRIGEDVHGKNWDSDSYAMACYEDTKTLNDMSIGQLTETLKEIKLEAEAFRFLTSYPMIRNDPEYGYQLDP